MEESLDVRMVQSVAPATPSTTYNNKVPKKGEIIFNDELNNFKVGNGSTSYGNLNDFFANTTYQLTLNGTTNGNGFSLGTLYAPTIGQPINGTTTNQLLLSQGTNSAPTWTQFTLDLNTTKILKWNEGSWEVSHLQSLSSDNNNYNMPILTRSVANTDNTGDRTNSYFSGQALLNHSNGGLTLKNYDYIVHLTPSNDSPLTLHAISGSSITPITHKIITTNGLINNPTTSDTFLKWNGSTFDWAALPTSQPSNGCLMYYNGTFNWGEYATYSLGGSGNKLILYKNIGGTNNLVNSRTIPILAKATPNAVSTTQISDSSQDTYITHLRIYAGDNIILKLVNEAVSEGQESVTGLQINAQLTTIPKATDNSIGGIKLKSTTTISSVEAPSSSGTAYPVQLTSDGVAGVQVPDITTQQVLTALLNAVNNSDYWGTLTNIFTSMTLITNRTYQQQLGNAFRTILNWGNQ